MQGEPTIDAILEYMRPVAIVGIGKTAFGVLSGDLRSLAVEAITGALADGHIDVPYRNDVSLPRLAAALQE